MPVLPSYPEITIRHKQHTQVGLTLNLFDKDKTSNGELKKAYPNANSSITVLPTQVAPFFNRAVTATAVFLAASCVLSQSRFPNPVT